MEEHKIGTDSTIHEHIHNIQERRYVTKKIDEFVPTKLGLSLVHAYRSTVSELSNTKLRAEMESNVREIAEGKLDHQETVEKGLKRFEEVYARLDSMKDEFLERFNEIYKASEKSVTQKS